MIKKTKLLITILLILFLNSYAYAKSNIVILYKINNTIITSIDIENEIKYLIALNNKLIDLDDKKIKEIAENSIIREKIKEIELIKYFVLDQKNSYLNVVVKNFYIKLGLENEQQFEEYLNNYNLTIKKLIKKIEIETTWNQLIYDKYNKQININTKNLEKIVDKNIASKKSKNYLLSEIVFEKSINESIDDRALKIKNSIKEIGFKNTANTYSIAESAKFGGDIGWLEEVNLSKKIVGHIKKLRIGEITKPILNGKNYLILKLESIKEEPVKIKRDVMLKRLIQSEQNRQLTQFSNIYFNKVKINTSINEL